MTAIAGWISTEFYKGRHPEAFPFSSLTGLRVCDLEEETYQLLLLFSKILSRQTIFRKCIAAAPGHI
jgi:hypothetical protein